MSAMVAGAIGNPESFEQSPQHIPARQGYRDERQAYSQMLTERGLQAEPREHDDLRDHREALADRDIRHRFNQRHQAGLFHAASR